MYAVFPTSKGRDKKRTKSNRRGEDSNHGQAQVFMLQGSEVNQIGFVGWS